MKGYFGALSGLLLLASPSIAQQREPTVQELETQRRDALARQQEAEAKKKKEDDEQGNVCMPCVGPHIDLRNGGLKFFSWGPGLEF